MDRDHDSLPATSRLRHNRRPNMRVFENRPAQPGSVRCTGIVATLTPAFR